MRGFSSKSAVFALELVDRIAGCEVTVRDAHGDADRRQVVDKGIAFFTLRSDFNSQVLSLVDKD